MSTEQNKAIARRHFEEVWMQGRVELLDEYYAIDVPASDYQSLQQLRDRILWWRKAAPGFKFTILDMVAEGDKVATYWQVDVTYSVPADPPPTDPMPPLGTPVSWKGVHIMRFADGRLVAQEGTNGWLGMLVESGVYALRKPESA